MNVDVDILEYNAVWTCRQIPTIPNIMPLSLALKMKALCFSETLVSALKSTLRHNPEDQDRHLHFSENLNSLGD
jgi:hypothetical protein